MPLRTMRIIPVVVIVVLTFSGCGQREVSSPQGNSASVISEVTLGSERFNLVSVVADLPPRTTFKRWELPLRYQHDGKASSANCCVRLKIGETVIDGTDLSFEGFDTKEKTIRVELVYLVPVSVDDVTLRYKDAQAGPALKVLK